MKKFYDIHMHAFDLSHPNLSAFVLRKGLIDSLLTCKTRWLLPIVAILPRLTLDKAKKYLKEHPFIKNTLAFYEIPIEYQFLLVDYFLKNPNNTDDIVVGPNNVFKVDDDEFSKIVMCPLAIDFGYSRINEEGVFYNKAPYKPIAKQVGDLFYSIKTYYRFNLVPDPNNPLKLKLEEITGKTLEDIKREKLFEIYPFMGLNTQNYSLEDLKGENGKQGLLDKYFSNFTADETAQSRRDRLFQKMGQFDGKMYEDDESIYKDIFAGIKVYPPLGFNPHPDSSVELDKVKYLYEYCISKRIPIISHCSDGGFEVGEDKCITDPREKWTKVLNEYPTLTLDFAHFGMQRSGATDWQKAIVELTKKENVYSDVSCNDADEKYYKNLNLAIEKAGEHLKSKMLFGSDFSIALISSPINSYNQYLKAFVNSKSLRYKQPMSVTNPERFLFGDVLP